MNVPAGSAFYLTILGNSLVVTGVKLLFSDLVFPPVALRLARYKYGVGGSAVITRYELAVRVHQSQVMDMCQTHGPDNARFHFRQTRSLPLDL